MKSVSNELKAFLDTAKTFHVCDLYELTLQSGVVYRYADYDLPVLLPDGRLFASSNRPVFKRGKLKINSKIEVDKLTVTLYIGTEDRIGGVPMMRVAHSGGLDESRLTLSRCFMREPGDVVGIVEMFGGYVEIKSGGGLELQLEVKSAVRWLNVDFPMQKYYPTCPWNLYGAGCGLNIDNWKSEGTVVSAQNTSVATVSVLTEEDGYYNEGGVEFLSGALAGIIAPVRRSWDISGNTKIEFLMPLAAIPAYGDTVKIYPGCDKSPATCENKFNNYLRNRATPFVPLKETIV